MRIFVLVSDEKNIVCRKGVVSRFVVSSLLISRSIRRNAISCIYLEDRCRAIFLYGSSIRQLRADEASAWGIVRKALKSSHKRPHTGVIVENLKNLEEIVKKFKVDKILKRSSIGVEVEKAVKNVNSFIYITCLSTELKFSSGTPIFFRSRLRPEQEVAVINILCDRAGVS
ncbi:MAG: hypothetical protein GXO10_05550 [Crenarchaeota archaeon]|nr:hypothetical protein [Thermoproteota archaeon]